MRKVNKVLRLSQIVLNQGQLDWLPRNPRTWTQQDIDRTAASIEEDPDFLEDRPLLVVPLDEVTFLTFAGNLRHEGCIYNGRETAPCVIYYPETEEDRQTVIRRAMKDNGSFGRWDTDLLKSDWSGMPLGDWGVRWDEGETQDAGHNVNFTAHNKAKEDEFDEGKDEIHVLCRPGDIWQLGEHRLMCGDSADLQQVKTLLGGGKM